MKLYLAARFETGKALFPVWHERLVILGYDVVSTWYIEQEKKMDESMTQGERREPSERDLGQLDAMDAFIMVNQPSDYVNDRTCGRHHELGYSICRRRRSQVGLPRIVMLGVTRSIFHSYADEVLEINASLLPVDFVVKRLDQTLKTLFRGYPPCYR